MHQQGLARERLRAVPAGGAELARRYRERRHTESCLVLRPTAFEIAQRQVEHRQLEFSRGMIRLQREGQFKMETRLVIAALRLLHDTDVDVRIGRPAVHR